jgi:predicted RNA methylase
LIYRRPPGEAAPTSAPVMIVGANNVFEVDCCSEALKIGDNNILEVKCLYNQGVIFLTEKYSDINSWKPFSVLSMSLYCSCCC